LGNIGAEKPGVVIMMGPFDDMNHPHVKNDMTKVVLDIDQELYLQFVDFFAEMISGKVYELYKKERCCIRSL
jgi:hypothetical protein